MKAVWIYPAVVFFLTECWRKKKKISRRFCFSIFNLLPRSTEQQERERKQGAEISV